MDELKNELDTQAIGTENASSAKAIDVDVDKAQDEAIEEEISADESVEIAAEADAAEGEKAPNKFVTAFKRFWTWLKAHENIRQMVFFIGFSLICFAIEYITFAILSACLKKVNDPFDWFLFHYATPAGGVGGFVAFLVSNIIAQICTFVLNRKKTFNATNNIVISGIMYAILVVIIILLNTWLGGIITEAIADTKPNNDTIATIGGYVGKFTGSFLSFVINFVGCKFLVMRNWGSKKASEKAAEADSDIATDTAIATDSAELAQEAASDAIDSEN